MTVWQDQTVGPQVVGEELMNNKSHYKRLIEMEYGCFTDEFNTRLIIGDDEPI